MVGRTRWGRLASLSAERWGSAPGFLIPEAGGDKDLRCQQVLMLLVQAPSRRTSCPHGLALPMPVQCPDSLMRELLKTSSRATVGFIFFLSVLKADSVLTHLLHLHLT